jgi:hypothetical protein
LSLTAKDIAQAIAGPDGNLQPVIERVRHWTREGLLVPLGDRNPGTGRKRSYDEDAIVSARIFNILADFGIGIPTMRRTVQHGTYVAKSIADKKARGLVCFLCIYKRANFVLPAKLVREQTDPGIQVMFTTIREDDSPRMHKAEAVLIINLTKLLS